MRFAECRALLLAGFGFAAACGGETAPPIATRELITIRTLGLAYLEENDLAAAEAEFRKLTELAPDEALGHANLGLVHLRRGGFAEAEEEIRRARDLDRDDAEIRLLLAKVFELTDRRDDARRELESGLAADSTNPKILYALAELFPDLEDDASRARRRAHLEHLTRVAPANVPARLQLIDVLLRDGLADDAAAQLEEIRRQVPDLPPQSTEFFDEALRLVQMGEASSAVTPAGMFHNVLRVTPVYQAGLDEVRGPGGALVGLPLVTFSQVLSLQARDQQAILDALRFTDVTDLVGLDSVTIGAGDAPSWSLALGDYDGDNDQDVFVSVGPIGHLFRNEGVTYSEVAEEAGVRSVASPRSSMFVDYDNDTRLDLFLTGPQGQLLRNDGSTAFGDRSSEAGVGDGRGVRQLWIDGDHDGDLDLFVAGAGPDRLYRNNMDGTFTEMAARWGIAGGDEETRAVGFADFDADDDIDLIVATESGVRLYSNLRGGRFEDVTTSAGLGAAGGGGALAVGDYDNDGFFDVLVVSHDGRGAELYRNQRDGTLRADRRPTEMLAALQGFMAQDAIFFDFDNDGWLDIAVAGRPSTGRGVRLFRNAGPGAFDDMTSILPEGVPAATHLAVSDYGEDRDLDLFVVGPSGLTLLRNDGGNANHSFQVRLRAQAVGSGKVNHFGIGSKVEARAGQLYQARMATHEVTHFGLGQRLKAEVVRILWTNGVPQNRFYPGSDQDLIEEQVLKGSCAFLYTWTGERFEFLKDVTWRSALGMPLGIMTGKGTQTFAPAFASQEYVLVPGDKLVERDGRYTIQLTEELWEVAYMDEVKLIAVDHPPSIDVFVNERFVPPVPTELELFHVGARRELRAATDENGSDLLPALRAKDDIYVSNLEPGRYQGLTKTHDLVLDFGDLGETNSVRLFLQGWIYPTDASINVAMAQNEQLSALWPILQVRDGAGRWKTVIDDAGFPAGKDKTVIVDLSGKFLSDDHRVRIRTNMEIYWDHAFVSVGESASQKVVTTLAPRSSDLHRRGYSRMYRKGGRFGPHWFDYETVSDDDPWQPITGTFTRYGSTTPLLMESDDRYVIMAPGDELTITFAVEDAPPVRDGWVRDFLIYTDGWIKDADLNTATGHMVSPLPFHAMSAYPYDPVEQFPIDSDHRRYLEQYQTRVVNR